MGKVVGKLDPQTGDVIFNDAPEVPKQRTRSTLQGFTYATADELEAALTAPFSLLSGEAPDLGTAYEQNVADIRSKLKAYKTEYPVESAAFEIGGAVAPTLALSLFGPPGSGTASTSRMLPTLQRLYGVGEASIPSVLGRGATEAALYEFGAGEGGVKERLKGVPEAAVTGSGAGLVFKLGGHALGSGIGAIVNTARNKFGQQSANVVESELQRIVSESGLSIDEVIDAVSRGETLAEISETTRRTLGAYLADLGDKGRDQLRQRASKARGEALSNTQQVLSGDSDVNVLKIFREGVDEADRLASGEYNRVYSEFGDLPDSINTTLADILTDNIDEAPEILRGLRLQGIKDPFFKVVKGNIEIMRTPTLKEAERVRSALSDFALNSKGQMKSDYKALEAKLRAAIDEASPELRDVRAVWATTRRGAELFDQGRKVFSKSADEIEIDFEKVAQEGGDALAAYRQGVMDAIRNKKDIKRLSNLLTDMEKKEAQIFAQIFPEGEYKKAYDLWDKARRSQAVVGEFGQSATAERIARRERMGVGAFVKELVGTLGFSARDASRLAERGLKAIGQNVSDEQQKKIVNILFSEDKDLVIRALKDNKGWDEVQKRLLQIKNSLGSGAQSGAAPVASGLTGQPFSEQMFKD